MVMALLKYKKNMLSSSLIVIIGVMFFIVIIFVVLVSFIQTGKVIEVKENSEILIPKITTTTNIPEITSGMIIECKGTFVGIVDDIIDKLSEKIETRFKDLFD